MKFLNAIDMVKNAIRNFVVDPRAAAPGQPVVGLTYYDTTLARLQIFNGTSWGLTADNAVNLNGRADSYYLTRGNHTGTQTAATISDLSSTVKAYPLSDFSLPTANVNINSKRLTNVANPTDAQDAATMGWVTAQVQSAAAGIDSKASVRALANSNITLSGTQTVDGIALAAGDRVLVRGQTTAAQNGVYVVATGAWARAADADQAAELTPGAFWFVEQGTAYARTQWRIENTGTITPGTTSISINQFGATGSAPTAGPGIDIAGSEVRVKLAANSGLTVNTDGLSVNSAGFARKYAVTLGDGTATTFTLTHNLGSKDVSVDLRLAETDEWIMADWVATNANTVTVTFGSAVPANGVRAVVIG